MLSPAATRRLPLLAAIALPAVLLLRLPGGAPLSEAVEAGNRPVSGLRAAASIPTLRPDLVRPERLEAISRAYLGTPYRLGCLGEGAGPDPGPLFRRDYADCQTLVEQVVAEAIAPLAGGLDTAIRLIRYRDGIPLLENRHHFCLPDWLDQPWPARDVTQELLAAAPYVSASRRGLLIDRAAFLSNRWGASSDDPARWVQTEYIPRGDVPAVSRAIPDGSIALLMVNSPLTLVGHVGLLFQREGKITLRHASQRRKRVVDEPLDQYLARAPRRFLGLKVLQPDAARLAELVAAKD
jgi:hypothetical protein